MLSAFMLMNRINQQMPIQFSDRHCIPYWTHLAGQEDTAKKILSIRIFIFLLCIEYGII